MSHPRCEPQLSCKVYLGFGEGSILQISTTGRLAAGCHGCREWWSMRHQRESAYGQQRDFLELPVSGGGSHCPLRLP